jgi:hypothetical protein
MHRGGLLYEAGDKQAGGKGVPKGIDKPGKQVVGGGGGRAPATGVVRRSRKLLLQVAQLIRAGAALRGMRGGGGFACALSAQSPSPHPPPKGPSPTGDWKTTAITTNMQTKKNHQKKPKTQKLGVLVAR